MTFRGINRLRVRLAPLLAFAEDSRARAEVIRFIIVGLKSNAVYYLLYVALTFLGVGPKVAVTIVFVFGIVYAFWFNKSFVFRNRGSLDRQLVRYLIVYLSMWLINLLLLDLLTVAFGVDQLLAQLLIAMALTAPLFLAMRFFVFRSSAKPPFSPS